MTTAKAIKFMGAMAAAGSVEYGQETAIRKLARDVGITYWSAYRIVSGAAKSVTSDAFERIEEIYLGWCAREIKKLQAELREAKRDHPDLQREAEALVAKLMDAKAGRKPKAAARVSAARPSAKTTRKPKTRKSVKRAKK
jgi:hypothetical protein